MIVVVELLFSALFVLAMTGAIVSGAFLLGMFIEFLCKRRPS